MLLAVVLRSQMMLLRSPTEWLLIDCSQKSTSNANQALCSNLLMALNPTPEDPIFEREKDGVCWLSKDESMTIRLSLRNLGEDHTKGDKIPIDQTSAIVLCFSSDCFGDDVEPKAFISGAIEKIKKIYFGPWKHSPTVAVMLTNLTIPPSLLSANGSPIPEVHAILRPTSRFRNPAIDFETLELASRVVFQQNSLK